jgi:hypothetical protein
MLPPIRTGMRGAAQQVVDQRGGGRLAVGAGDADDAVRGQVRRAMGEQFDVADDRHPRRSGVSGDGMGIERHARARRRPLHNRPGRSLTRIGQFHPAFERAARLLAVVPGHDLRAARQQALDRGQPRTGEPEDRKALSRKGG